jgi:thiol reductant ABC exporter CydC subunit
MTSTRRRLLELAEAPCGRVALSVGLGAATVLCGVGLMATAGYLISRAVERPAVLSLTVAIVCVRFFGLTRPIARYLERLVSHDLALRVLAGVRVQVFERIEPLAPSRLEGYRSGDLLARMVADVDALQNLHLRGMLPPLVALLAGGVSVAVTAAVLPVAAAVLAAGLIAVGIGVPLIAGTIRRRVATLVAAARADLTSELIETTGGASELVVYGREGERLAALEAADRALVRVSRRAALADGAADGLGLILAGATVAGVLAVSVSAHEAGALDRVMVATLALLALASFEAVRPLAQSARELSETLAAGERVLELVERDPDIVDPPEPAPFPAKPFVLELDDVHARVLAGVSLRLEPGRRVALTGASGAGKTTVVDLLVRFLDPEAGRVTLDGRDLRNYRQEDLRRAIAVAGQDSHVFSTTIRANVRLARPDASDEELEDALRRARILDWVRDLPDGWDTLVGEEGRELSGGQRQRLVVARALLADARVLVLDEPTAHLDTETAERLIDDVLDAAAGRTVLLITHRPEGLDRMHEVVRLPG